MADSFIGITEPASPNKKLDSESLAVGLNTVERERVQIAGDSATDIAPVTAADGLSVKVTNSVPVTGPLTDAQLRATPVPVSGTVATGGLTDTELRATPVPVSAASLPLPSGAATSALQDGIIKDGAGDTTQANVSGGRLHVDGSGVTQPVSGTFFQATQPISATDLDIRDLSHTADSVKIGDGTDIADVLDLTNSNPLTVAIVDGSGTQITSFGGGTQYTEGDTDASITGTAILWESTSDTLKAVSTTFPLPTTIQSSVPLEISSLLTYDLDTGAGTNNNKAIGLLKAESGGPVLVGSANPMPVNDAAGSLTVDQATGTNLHTVVDSGSITNTLATAASFGVHYGGITPGNNKYMAVLFNTSSTRKVVVQRITVVLDVFAAITGVYSNQFLLGITAFTSGTPVTIRAEDTSDTLSAGISADTASTAVTDNHTKFTWLICSEEPTTAATNSQLGGTYRGRVLYERIPGTRGITLRENEGIAVKNATNTTVGSFTYYIEFTDEAA